MKDPTQPQLSAESWAPSGFETIETNLGILCADVGHSLLSRGERLAVLTYKALPIRQPLSRPGPELFVVF
jgi:hypothetical protein